MKYIIANWKMNLPDALFDIYLRKIDKIKSHNLKIIIAPPSCYIGLIKDKYPNLNLACQNFSSVEVDYGSFTGEVSAKMMELSGAKYSIIGHSERRVGFLEVDKEIITKTRLSLSAGIKPVICIGENFESSSNYYWQEFLANQIENSVIHTSSEILVAYEPIWAIGSGNVATTDQIIDRIGFIEKLINKVAKNALLVYGGSVTGKSAKEIANIQEICGVLVGGASLNIDEFLKIVEAYA